MTQFDSYPQALDALSLYLSRREFSPEVNYVVLCPDRYTQTVEQALFCGEHGGALDLEVLTLSRLGHRLAPKSKSLSAEGGVMITARAVAAAKGRLKYFGRAAEFSDFAREAYVTVQQIVSSDVNICDVKATGATKIKLDDLAEIKAEYDRIKGDYLDAPDKLISLINSADCDFVRRTHFFAIGYSDATKLIKKVFNALSEHAASFALYDAPPQSKRRESLDLYCAPDRICEYKKIATEIRDHIHCGGRYDDVAIICEKPRALKRILAEYEIPSYTDESKPLYYSPPLSAIECVYKLHSAYSRNTIDCSALVSAAKNPYIGCDAFDAERLLYEINTRALSFVPTEYEFIGDGARAATRVMSAVREFSACSSFAAAVKRTVELCDFAAVQRATAQNQTDCITPITALVELLERYGSGNFDVDAKAFFAAALYTDINTLPRERDCVTVTSPTALRLSAVKKLFITDFNEGIMPQAISDTGLISDGELHRLGGVIEPSVRGRNRMARDELKAVVYNAESVFITYCTASGKSAAFIDELAQNINRYDFSEESAVLQLSRDAQFIAKHASVPSAARELVARRLSAHAKSVDACTQKSTSYFAPFEDRVDIKHKPTLSVSELSHWFTCPYARFLRDSVGVKERRSGFGAPDFGIVVHDFMRRFVQTSLDCSVQAVKRIMDEVLAEKGLRLDEPTYARMISDAVDYAVANAKILQNGEYSVAATEYRFGGKKFGQQAQFEFIGYIDRYDLCGDRARIIDYKTGNKKFSIEHCRDGTDMQLPLYAYALPYDVTGMFYVRPTKKYSTTGGTDRAMSGCMVMDVGVARQYDSCLDVGVSSDIIQAKLKVDKDTGDVTFASKNSSLLDSDEFEALVLLCAQNAHVAADEIACGYIMRSPIDGACGYCPYVGICGDVQPRVCVIESEEEE